MLDFQDDLDSHQDIFISVALATKIKIAEVYRALGLASRRLAVSF